MDAFLDQLRLAVAALICGGGLMTAALLLADYVQW